MKLIYTPKSHFARKNRILLDALELDVELIDAGNVADSTAEIFANNPLMKVPTLIDGEELVFESDHIAQYIVHRYDQEDRFKVLSKDLDQLNVRAVMNGVMGAEVELIMAERTGINTQNYSRFDKFKSTVVQGMEWLESHVDLFSEQPTYSGFHLVCLWDHLALYEMFDLPYHRLKDIVQELSNLEYVANSSPY